MSTPCPILERVIFPSHLDKDSPAHPEILSLLVKNVLSSSDV